MIKRIIKTILFIPVCFVSFLIQLPYELVRWIITGEELGDAWLVKLVEW